MRERESANLQNLQPPKRGLEFAGEVTSPARVRERRRDNAVGNLKPSFAGERVRG